MSTKIQIKAGPVQATATLNNSATAQIIADALPIKASANTLGRRKSISAFRWTLAWSRGRKWWNWATWAIGRRGRAFCIFFGPTPASRGDEIRPASAVTVIGRVCGDATAFKRAPAGAPVTIEIVEE